MKFCSEKQKSWTWTYLETCSFLPLLGFMDGVQITHGITFTPFNNFLVDRFLTNQLLDYVASLTLRLQDIKMIRC